MPKKLRVLSWNVNGVRASYKKGLLDWMNDESPDILCLQETKAQPEQLPKKLVQPEGYHAYWESAEKKGYSGVAVITKEEPNEVSYGLGIKRFDDEGRVLRLDYDDFVLFNVYFPNGKKDDDRLQYKMDFYDAFLDAVEELRKSQPRILFCGDVNTAHNEIDLARPKENEKISGFLRIERDWIDTAIGKGYTDTFRSLYPDVVKYSWWDLKSRARERDIGWRIDYVFVSQELLPAVKDAFIMTEVTGSDHCPVGVDLETD
jgi:exodeoxyribonuclease-3